MLGECPHVVKREHRIEIAQNGARFRCECGFTAAARPQVNLALARRNISIREIDRRLCGFAECVVNRIAGHADDREASRARLYAAADRIRTIQVAPDKLLIDDGLRGRRLISHLGKIVSFKEWDGLDAIGFATGA